MNDNRMRREGSQGRLQVPPVRRTVETQGQRRRIEVTEVQQEQDMEERRNSQMSNRVSKKTSAHKKKIKRLWTILAVEVVFFGLLIIGYGVYYMNSKLNQLNYEDIDEEELSINEGLSDVTKEKYTTIALFGLDARDVTSDEGNRSDTIIIASINNETKEVRLLSIYRDTYMQFSSSTSSYDGCYSKITHAYAYGGAKGSVATLNRNMDLQITDYVTVNFLSLADIVDDLGGITVNVDYDEMNSINIWLPETAQIAGRSYKGLYETGDVTLDGLQAVTYCRIRNIGAGDIDRAGRQREVLSAILDKAKQSDMATLNKIMDDVLPEISTSLTKQELLTLMSSVFEYELTENDGFPFVYNSNYYYDEIAGQDLSIVVSGDLEYNVELAHEFLYDAVIDTTSDNSYPSVDDTSSDSGEATSEIDVNASNVVDEEQLYTPSITLQNINEAIINKTGVYKYDDPEFRGQF